jgi:hypothetical protein
MTAVRISNEEFKSRQRKVAEATQERGYSAIVV